jgi:hypothetical protein
MADNILKLIPIDPLFVPDDGAQQTAIDYLSSWLPQADAVGGTASDEVNFVDQGDNWERVICPACGTELDRMVWQELMDAAFQTQFADLTVTMPCCGAVSSLNDLHYEWPAGFARFVLESLNPQTDLDDEQLEQLAQILGCPLHKIWARY